MQTKCTLPSPRAHQGLPHHTPAPQSPSQLCVYAHLYYKSLHVNFGANQKPKPDCREQVHFKTGNPKCIQYYMQHASDPHVIKPLTLSLQPFSSIQSRLVKTLSLMSSLLHLVLHATPNPILNPNPQPLLHVVLDAARVEVCTSSAHTLGHYMSHVEGHTQKHTLSCCPRLCLKANCCAFSPLHAWPLLSCSSIRELPASS